MTQADRATIAMAAQASPSTAWKEVVEADEQTLFEGFAREITARQKEVAAETRGPRKTGRISPEPVAAAEAEVAKPAVARAPGKRTKAAITVHSFPGKPAVVEPHILNAAEALAIRPMTIEEAVKEAEFRDRDLLIFRNQAGEMFVLHRRRDGKMELVEIPS